MISHLYNLDLENVNRMITEINSTFANLGVEEREDNDSGHLLGSAEIGHHGTELFIDGLNMKQEEIWGFDIHVFNSALSSISMYFNNDKNEDHYKRVRIQSANGAAVSAGTATDAIISGETDANNIHSITGTITLTKDSKDVFVKSIGYSHVGSVLVMQGLKYEMMPAHDNIFKISIEQSVVNAMSKDSHLRVWKMTHRDAIV